MGASLGTDQAGSVDVELNVVPFIDLMSCLTAFLLVTAVWSQFKQISIKPKGLSRNIEKEVDPSHRSKVIYRLSQKGRDLLPVMLEITAWSGKYDSKSNAPKAFLTELKKDRRRLADRVLAALDEVEER